MNEGIMKHNIFLMLDLSGLIEVILFYVVHVMFCIKKGIIITFLFFLVWA